MLLLHCEKISTFSSRAKRAHGREAPRKTLVTLYQLTIVKTSCRGRAARGARGRGADRGDGAAIRVEGELRLLREQGGGRAAAAEGDGGRQGTLVSGVRRLSHS